MGILFHLDVYDIGYMDGKTTAEFLKKNKILDKDATYKPEENLTFIDLVKIIYDLTNFIVIGTDVIYKDIKPFVCLNPYNYQFSPFDHLIYLLASKQPNENEINYDLLTNPSAYNEII